MSDVLVVTGASRGIGAATARLAGARGASVAVNYNSSPEHAEEVVKAVERAGGRAIAVEADVSTEEGATHLFEVVDAQLGPLTQLFNNAGVFQRYERITETRLDTLDRIWRVNISSQFLCAREAVRRMSTKLGGKGGAIVNMSSAGAYIGGAGGILAYAASKGAIDTFTRGLALECADQGIRVNAVRPGFIETDIHDQTGEAQRLKRVVTTVPVGRIGTPEEVAEAVLWLLSPAASYVTDTLVDLAGGR